MLKRVLVTAFFRFDNCQVIESHLLLGIAPGCLIKGIVGLIIFLHVKQAESKVIVTLTVTGIWI